MTKHPRVFEPPALGELEREVIQRVDQVKQELRYMMSKPAKWRGLLRRDALARAIRGSNSIEGLHVSEDEAIAAMEGAESLDPKTEASAAFAAYHSAMTYVLQLADDPHFGYSADLIRSLHYMMLQYDLSKSPGRWRLGPIRVSDEERKEVVYVGPDPGLVPELMSEMIRRIRDHESAGLPAMVNAALAHLNLVMVHPFRDGNGRMGRCIQTIVLVRAGTSAPEFSSIEEYLGRKTRDYYAALAEAGRGKWSPDRDTRPWVRFCLKAHWNQVNALVRRNVEMRNVWDDLESLAKKHGLPERTLFALSDAAFGLRVRNPIYKQHAEVSPVVASRDMTRLTKLGLLEARGEKRGRYYIGGKSVLAIRGRHRASEAEEDPFKNPH